MARTCGHCHTGEILLQWCYILHKQTDKTFDLLTKAIRKQNESVNNEIRNLCGSKYQVQLQTTWPMFRKSGLKCLTEFVIFVNIIVW